MNDNQYPNHNTTETRQLLHLAIPAIIAQLAQMGMGVIDTIMAGHYSAEALAAIAMGNNLMNPVILFVLGILLALNPLAAQLNGRQQWPAIAVLFHSGMALALLLAIPSFFIMRNFAPVLALTGLDSAVAAITLDYLDAISWGLVVQYLFLALRFTNEGLFANKMVMLVVLSALPLNAVLNYWFIYGGLGVPAMGVVGTGWASDIANCYMFVTLLLCTARTRQHRHIDIFRQKFKPDMKTIGETIKLGFPIGLATTLEVSLFAAVGLMIGSYSVAQIAAHQIAINITSVSYMMPLGLSIAITARVGFHMGRNRPLEAKNSGYLGILMAIAIMMFNAILLIGLPGFFTAIYSNDSAVIAIAGQLLFLAALFQLPDGAQAAAIGALRGMKDTRIPVMLTFFAYWMIGFPLAYWLGEFHGYGLKGYWMALVGALLIAALLLGGRFIHLINSHIRQRQAMDDPVLCKETK